MPKPQSTLPPPPNATTDEETCLRNKFSFSEAVATIADDDAQQFMDDSDEETEENDADEEGEVDSDMDSMMSVITDNQQKAKAECPKMGAIDEKLQTKLQSPFTELFTEPNIASPSDSNASAASNLSQASLPPSKKKAVANLKAFSP